MGAETATFIRGKNLGKDQNGYQVNAITKAVFHLDNTADATDTLAITLADYGITTFWGICGFKETTDGSVIVIEDPTTSVTSGVLTLTIPAGTDNDPRTYIIYGV